MAFGNLTVDYTRLSRLPARGRSELSRNLRASEIFGNMSPSEIAALFPDYYKKYISGKTSISSGLSGANLTAPYTDTTTIGEQPVKVEPTLSIDEMKRALLEKGIDVDRTYEVVNQTGVLEGDNRIKHLRGASAEELDKMGLERFSDEKGKSFIREKPTKASTLTNEQVLVEYKKNFSSDNFTPREQATLDFIAKREGSEDPNIVFGGEKYKARLGLDKKPLTEHTVAEVFALQDKLRVMTKADGYGRSDTGEILGTSAVGAGQMIEGTLRSNLKALGIKEEDFDKIKFDKKLQDRLTLQNFKSSGIGDPNADPSTWNQQRLGQQYESLNTSRGHSPMTVKEAESIKSASPERLASEEGITFAEAREKLEEQEKQQRKEEQTRFTYRNDILQPGEASASKVTSEVYADPNSIGSYAYADDREQFALSGTAKQRGVKEVDARIVDIMEKTAKEFPLRVRLFSGKRDSGGHGAGVATDIQIFDEDGNPIGSYQTPQTSNIYAMFALKAREVQMRDYPELKDKFVWGGSWSGMEKSGGGKYGAADWMDFRIGHSSQDTMAAFKWPDPSKPGEGGWQKGYEHYTEGDFLGLGSKMPTAQDFEKLKGFRLTEEQNIEQYQLAQRIGANAGLLSQPNIGGRQLAGGEYVAPGDSKQVVVTENVKEDQKVVETPSKIPEVKIPPTTQLPGTEPMTATPVTERTIEKIPEVTFQTKSKLPGTEPMTAMPLVDEKNKGDVPIMDLNPKMKLGGTQNFEEPNNVRESMSLNVNGQPVVEFNNKERAVVEDGQIKVENEFVRKTKEVQEMNDKGVQRNEFKMRQTVESVKTYPEQVKYGIVPESPSIARQTKMAQFGGYNHFSRGSKNA